MTRPDAGRPALADAEARSLAEAGGRPVPPASVTARVCLVLDALRHEIQGVGRDRLVLGLPGGGPCVLGSLVAAGMLEAESARARARDAEPGREVAGIDWSGSGLGHTLPAAVGFALAARFRGDGARTFAVTFAEELSAAPSASARLLAASERLSGLIVVALGPVPPSLADGFAADGWEVFDAAGDDLAAFASALAQAALAVRPVLVLAGGDSLPGGAGPARADLQPAPVPERPHDSAYLAEGGTPRAYAPGSETDTRGAVASALTALAALAGSSRPAQAVRLAEPAGCAGSGERAEFAAPDRSTPFVLLDAGFLLAGVAPASVVAVAADSAAVTIAAALSLGGVAAWLAGPATLVSGAGDALQLCAVNGAGVKLVVDACSDRPATRAPNLFGVVNGIPGVRLYTPADPTQADRAVRFMATHRGSFVLALPASAGRTILREDGMPLFDDEYVFTPNRADRVRRGEEIAVACTGSVLPQALEAWEELRARGRIVDLFSVAAWGDLGEASLVEMARHGRLVCVEDHGTRTGLGTFLQARFNDLGLLVRVRKMGSGATPPLPAADYHRVAGLDPAAIVRAVTEECIRRGTLGPRIDPDVVRMM